MGFLSFFIPNIKRNAEAVSPGVYSTYVYEF